MKPEILFSALAVLLAAGALIYPVYTAREDRNAALVQIGVAVLRADPAKEGQISAAREWALNLIDANAGGVKFSAEARKQLIGNRLEYIGSYVNTYLPDTCYTLKGGVAVEVPCAPRPNSK